MFVIKNRVAPKFHANVNFNQTNNSFPPKNKNEKQKNEQKRVGKCRKVMNKIGSKKSPEAKAIYIYTPQSNASKKVK